jgi:hypothetical protein
MNDPLKLIHTTLLERPNYLIAILCVLAFVILGVDFLLWNGKIDVEVMDIVKITSKG